MKGPGIRLDLEVRREWKCPLCGKLRRATGDVVAMRCGCTRERENMKLLERQRQTRSFADVIKRVQTSSNSGEPRQPPEPGHADDDKLPSTGNGVGEALQSPTGNAAAENGDSPPPNPESPGTGKP